jgi:tetratricopeptide (TPR) repeat protein
VVNVHTMNSRLLAGRSAGGTLASASAALGLALLLTCLAGCSSGPQAKEETPKGDPVALGVVAEIALERGDCKTASETYAKATQASPDPKLARHATLVALKCEHLPAAWQSASRWRSLAPANAEADARYAAVAVRLYHLSEARAAITDFSRAPLPSPSHPSNASGAEQSEDAAGAGSDSAAGAPAGKKGEETEKGKGSRANAEKEEKPLALSLTALAALLLEESDAPTVLSAMSSTLESNPSPEATALLSELALGAYDAERAQRYAEQALQRNPKDAGAKVVLARAYVIRGDAAKAIATAREAMQDDPERSTFDLVDVLVALDRLEDAHQELERLRSREPASEIDRRLALLAYEAGDMKEAQQRFAELAASGEGNEAALLYLADIAARDGDTDAAIAGYRRLYDSSVALSARSRAAALLFARSDRKEALTLLDDYVSEHPDTEVDLTVAKAHLLADHGEADAAIELLNTSLDRHPKHPSIEYERAVILEQSGRVHDSVEALQRLLSERTDDPTLLNALGYTLADHNLELAHAESLIRRALVIMPDNPAALDSLGWVRFRQGDSKSALTSLQRAYTISHDSEIAAHWGEALWVSGDHSQARKVWAAALAREPDSHQLKATLARFIPDAK